MKKSSPKKSLKGLSWTYIILSAIIVIGMITFACIPKFADKLVEYTGKKDSFINFEIQLGINALIYLWYFWLAKRFIDGKSSGIFYMVLLILGVVGGFVSFFLGYTKTISSIDFIIDVVALYFVLQIRKGK